MRNLWEELYSSGNDDAFMKCPYGIVTNIIKQYVQENNHKNVRDMNILELGCGSGANLYYAASIGMNVYGIDISPTAIEHAKKEFNSKNFIGGGKFRVSTFAPLEYDKDFFDIVIDRGGLVCADRNLLTNAIDEICRVIKKDGMVLFTPNSELRINVINIYNDALTFINQNLNTAGLYGKANSRIKNVYDFIKGLFLFCCLIYNLTFCNYLLILTVPFGIFGFINMYSFVEMNFFDKGKYKIEKATFQKLVNNANDKISNLKQEINKINDNLDFLREQKLSSISRIPELFSKDIESLLLNDEVKLAEQISEALLSSDMVKFTYLLEENTNLNTEDVINSLSNELNSKEDELSKYINDKLSERKNNQSKAMLMKKVKPIKAIFLVIALFISISSIIILINNFYEMNLYAFIVSMVVGAISMLIYNVDTGKHASLSDTFNDNLLVTVFNSTIVYDLIYSKLNNGLSITYGFLQIPLTFILIFMGFVLLISSIKYIYLLKKLRS